MTLIHGFELLEERDIPELNSHARLFRHKRTGAELLSLENEDENKVFGITFRTPPSDSTGVPHIMEHSVLDGSQKYPLKEPFVELVKSSLKTFLNAFTLPDKTCYPVASQNVQDFYNLIDVYMDAVLHPLIPPETLMQEGWHYEIEDPQEPLSYKGVVFNEMKGAYSSPDSLLSQYSAQSLYPDTTYSLDSGGDPAVIPNLTYEQFKNFHDTYYHPSNARIFFYGDDDPDERLRRMDAYLQDFDARKVDSSIGLQPRFERPRQFTFPYDASEEETARKSMVTVNWMLTEPLDPETNLAFQILAYILVGTPASPLRKALIDSGLGEDLTGAGLDSDLRQTYFSTGLKGIQKEDAGKVETLILETLSQLATEGIEEDMVAAAVNTIEFSLRENNTGSFPRGLVLMLRSLTTWLYGGDPLAPLAFEVPLTGIKERLETGEPVFEDLIREYLVENQHRTTVLLEPDSKLGERREAAERERLEQVRSSLSEQELEDLVEQTRLLKERQETPDAPEALAALPRLELEDLDPKIKTIPIELVAEEGTPLLFHDIFTNGILYLDLGFNLHTLPQEYLPYVSLFGRALLEMGTETENFVQLSRRIGRTTGGIRPSSLTSSLSSGDGSTAWLFLRGKCTMDHTNDLLSILQDVLLTIQFDNQERFRQMVLEEKASQEASLVPGGHAVVNTRLRSLFDEAGWAAEQMGGISYLFFLRNLAEQVDRDWPGVLRRLEEMRRLLVNRRVMLGNITIDAENWQTFRPQLEAFLENLPANERDLIDWRPEKPAYYEGLTIPAQVNYVGEGADLYELGYELDGSVSVITNYLRMAWLWEKVRVQGGAYGGFSLFDRRSGVFTFVSYRDPNLLKTLENYKNAADFLRKVDISRDELTKSIIGTIGDMDAYRLPDAKGYVSMVYYLTGDTDESRQQYREQVLGTSQVDFRAFGDVLAKMNQQAAVVVLGSQEKIQQANAERGDWLKVKKVL